MFGFAPGRMSRMSRMSRLPRTPPPSNDKCSSPARQPQKEHKPQCRTCLRYVHIYTRIYTCIYPDTDSCIPNSHVRPAVALTPPLPHSPPLFLLAPLFLATQQVRLDARLRRKASSRPPTACSKTFSFRSFPAILRLGGHRCILNDEPLCALMHLGISAASATSCVPQTSTNPSSQYGQPLRSATSLARHPGVFGIHTVCRVQDFSGLGRIDQVQAGPLSQGAADWCHFCLHPASRRPLAWLSCHFAQHQANAMTMNQVSCAAKCFFVEGWMPVL